MTGLDRDAVRRFTFVVIGVLAVACGSANTTPTGSAGSETPANTSPEATASASPSTAAAPSPSSPPFDPTAVALNVEVLVDSLDSPVDIATVDDGTGRLFVVEQAGRIRIVRDGALEPEPFLDIRRQIASGGERGLLGLAFHPEFPIDPRFFVDYTDTAGDTVVAEYRLDETNPDLADPESERILLRIAQPYPNHNGGGVVFGPDGMFYVATGDGGSGGDPHGNGQRLDTLLGKILRIDLDAPPASADTPYAIPDDNPFVDTADARPEIWLTGLRNPWRIRFDRDTGDLWIGDVGQGEWEEIDIAPAGTGGLNFGWNVMEGLDCFEPREGCDDSELTAPVAQYGHDLGCAVIGGVVVRDPDQPLLNGGYVFSDSCSGNLWLLDPGAGENPSEPVLVEETGRSISTIVEDLDGTVLATDLGSGELLVISGEAR